MSNTPSLLPCPFCGGMATAQPINSVPGWHHVTVLHSDCFYKPAQDKMLLNDEHLAAWNRRIPQPVVRDDTELIRQMLEAIETGRKCILIGGCVTEEITLMFDAEKAARARLEDQ